MASTHEGPANIEIGNLRESLLELKSALKATASTQKVRKRAKLSYMTTEEAMNQAEGELYIMTNGLQALHCDSKVRVLSGNAIQLHRCIENMKKGDITKEDIKRVDSLLSHVFKRLESRKVSKNVVQSGDAMDDLEMESFSIEDDDDDDAEM